jgi:cytochrome c oxidase cbb3-type subunit 3
MQRSTTVALAGVLVLMAGPVFAQPGPTVRQVVDAASASRGRAVYAQHCINCHGSNAKGGPNGPDLMRSPTVLRDRLGALIGPAMARTPASHPSVLTGPQITDLSHFLKDRIEAIARNRNPTEPIRITGGDAEAGRAYFNGAGTCRTCHSPTGDLAGVARRIPDQVNLQQRFLFPNLARSAKQVEVTVMPPSGAAVSGVLVRIDNFSVSLREATGDYRSFTRGPGVRVEVRDPLAAHHALLDTYTDRDIKNVVAYLETLK